VSDTLNGPLPGPLSLPDASAWAAGSDDVAGARQWLARAVGDDTSMAWLRQRALALADGTELSRIDDHQLVDHVAAAVAAGRLRTSGAAPRLQRLVPAEAPAPTPSPSPAPRPSTPRAAPVAAPAAVETTFGSDLEVAAMVAVLVQAAQDGTPFCEECAKAAAARAAEEATA
jgi:hypothetical protein